MHLSSPSLSIVLLCGGLLRNVIFSFSNSRCVQWPGFALIRLSCSCVINVMLLYCVGCTRLIRTRIIVCSVSFLPLLSKFDIPSCGCSSSIRVCSTKVRTSQLARRFLPGKTVVWNEITYSVFDCGTLDGFKVEVNNWLLQ